ncbi:hypothetical protein BKA69DRAFT_1091694 [Paraphysoderma sedebokerense]|nr:hypothetical protein BKA69DRAFT_1091694 [Paraphysoderma sedebokerense]
MSSKEDTSKHTSGTTQNEEREQNENSVEQTALPAENEQNGVPNSSAEVQAGSRGESSESSVPNISMQTQGGSISEASSSRTPRTAEEDDDSDILSDALARMNISSRRPEYTGITLEDGEINSNGIRHVMARKNIENRAIWNGYASEASPSLKFMNWNPWPNASSIPTAGFPQATRRLISAKLRQHFPDIVTMQEIPWAAQKVPDYFNFQVEDRNYVCLANRGFEDRRNDTAIYYDSNRIVGEIVQYSNITAINSSADYELFRSNRTTTIRAIPIVNGQPDRRHAFLVTSVHMLRWPAELDIQRFIQFCSLLQQEMKLPLFVAGDFNMDIRDLITDDNVNFAVMECPTDQAPVIDFICFRNSPNQIAREARYISVFDAECHPAFPLEEDVDLGLEGDNLANFTKSITHPILLGQTAVTVRNVQPHL